MRLWTMMTGRFGRLQCMLDEHRRDRKQVRYDRFRCVSVCARCGVPMARHRDGTWEAWRESDGADEPSA